MNLLMEYPVTKLSSSSSTSFDSLLYSTLDLVIFVNTEMRRLNTMNFIGITASWTYTNLNGVYPVNFLLVFLYTHSTTGILKS
jgi:hypothetical protein